MKVKVQMKDPDTLYDAINDAVSEQLTLEGLTDPEERESLLEIRRERIQGLAGKWFRYGEYLTVEIDTEAQTCTVLPARD